MALKNFGDFVNPKVWEGLPGNIVGDTERAAKRVGKDIQGAAKDTQFSINDLIGGGGGGTAAAAGAPYTGPDALGAYLANFNLQGIDPTKLRQYLQSTGKLKDPNNLGEVQTAVNALGLTPSYQTSSTTNDPIQQQMVYSQLIQPFLDQLSQASQQGQTQYQNEIAGINQMNPIKDSNLKNMIGGIDAAQNQSLGASSRAALGQAVTEPNIALILSALRQQYQGGIANLTPSSTGTAVTPKVASPFSSNTKIGTTLNPAVKTP